MKGVLFVIAACSLWAVDTLIRYPLLESGVSAGRIVFTEHFLLVIFFLPVIWKRRSRLWQARISHISYFIIVGGFGSALATLAFTKAFGLINPSLVILLQKLQPLVAISLARVVLKEPIHSKFLGWASICLLGGFLISFDDIFTGLDNINWHNALNSKALAGYLLTLVAVISWGSATVFGKKLELEGHDEQEMMAGRFLMGFICLIPLWNFAPFPFLDSPLVWGKIAIMAALSGFLGMYLYYKGLKLIPARLCTLSEMFFPFFAVAVNWIFLGASLGPLQIAGGVLLLIGSSVIQIKHY